MTERAEFEKWAGSQGFRLRIYIDTPPAPIGKYGSDKTQYALEGWQAGRAPLLAEIEALKAERDALRTICAEAYQVVGVLADESGRFGDGSVTKILDNLSQMKMVHSDVLPFGLHIDLARKEAK